MFTFLPRDAMLSTVYAVVHRVSVSLCVLSHYCIVPKHTQDRVNATRQPRESCFLTPNVTAKFERDHPHTGATNAGKIGHFRQITHYNSKTVQDRRIVSIQVE